jgi:hypothetical protein
MADTNWADAIQNIFSKGLDAAATIESTRLQVNDPTPNVTGANGRYAGKVGQSVGGSLVTSLPPAVWIGGAVVALALIGVLIFKRR